VDRRAFLLAVVTILWITVVVRRLVHPADAISWTYQVLMLCLLLAAIAGRSLSGGRVDHAPLVPNRPGDSGRDLAWHPAVAWGAIALAAILPHLHSLTIGFVSDDFGLAWIARDARSAAEAMRSTGLISFYRPLVMLGWWLGDRLWGGAPVGHHAAAVLLHSANGLLVFAIGRRLTGSGYGALMAALLFAVHPLHVEPVCWPAAGADVLCAGFSLLSLLAVHTFWTAAPGGASTSSASPPDGTAAPSRAGARGGARPLLLSGALAAFLLALLSKEVALALPGVVVLMLALTGGQGGRSSPGLGAGFGKPALAGFTNPAPTRFALVAGGYVAVLAGYLAWRTHVLGGLGGYALPRTFWNTVFPSNPLLLMGDFFFPVHATLFAQLGPVACWLALTAMAAGLLWWLAGLERVPGRRLWLWLGWVFLLAIPSWTFRWQPSAALEWTRFGYLPTIGLAWLFGDLCAGRGPGWKRSGAVAGCVIAASGALTTWYVMPWREAGRLARQAVAAGASLVEEHTTAQGPPTLYVSGLPAAYQGAPVLANCYPQAVNLALGKETPVRVVTAMPRAGGVHPEVMARWRLRPGEYLAAYDARTGRLEIVRQGTGARASPAGGGAP
jgi:hypothetical protein